MERKTKPTNLLLNKASQTTQSQGVCSLSSPLSLLRNVWFHIVFFFPKRPWSTENSATKRFNHERFVFNSSEKWSKSKIEISKIALKHCHFVSRPSLRRMGPAVVVYLPRKVKYLTPSHFLQDGAIHIRKVRRNAFQKCYRLLQQYPSFKGRHTVQFTGDDRSMELVP